MVATVNGRKPGRIGFWVGGLVVAAGVVFGAVLLVNGVRSIADTVEGYQRVPLPGGGTVLIDEPGTYRVFYEADGADDGFGSPGAVTILDPSGARLSLDADLSSETYSLSGFTGRKIGSFRAPVAGRYELRTLLTDGGAPATSSGTALAVGRRGPTGSVLTILGGVFGGLAIVGVGVVVLIVSGVRRGRANRALNPGAPMPGWGGPAGGPPGWVPPVAGTAPGVPWSPPGGPPAWAPPAAGPGPGGPPAWTPPAGPPSTLPPVPAPGSWSAPYSTASHPPAPAPPPPPPAPGPFPASDAASSAGQPVAADPGAWAPRPWAPPAWDRTASSGDDPDPTRVDDVPPPLPEPPPLPPAPAGAPEPPHRGPIS